MRARRRPPVAYTLMDHTADLGVEFTGESLSDLFAMAGAVLADILYDSNRVMEVESRRLMLQAETSEQMMVTWLNELIYQREVGEFVWRTVEADSGDGTRLSATLSGEPYRPDRHDSRCGIKAATYHLLSVSRERDAWAARIVFDV
jgi:SHS2 domain-containing protein